MVRRTGGIRSCRTPFPWENAAIFIRDLDFLLLRHWTKSRMDCCKPVTRETSRLRSQPGLGTKRTEQIRDEDVHQFSRTKKKKENQSVIMPKWNPGGGGPCQWPVASRCGGQARWWLMRARQPPPPLHWYVSINWACVRFVPHAQNRTARRTTRNLSLSLSFFLLEFRLERLEQSAVKPGTV